MTLSEAITRAVVHLDARAAGVVADVCRFRFDMTYEQTLVRVRRQYPNLGRAKWDALLYEADQEHSG